MYINNVQPFLVDIYWNP